MTHEPGGSWPPSTQSPRKRRPGPALILGVAGGVLLLLAATFGIGLGMGQAQPSAAEPVPTVTVTETVTATAEVEPVETEEPAEDEPQVFKMHELAQQGGIALKVDEAKLSPTVSVNATNYNPTSEYAAFENKPAREGATFAVVTTTVTNKGAKAIDLTCSLPVQFTVYNDGGQQFQPIDDLYKVQGNPECNDQLNPGFSSKMTWAFEVPSGSKIIGASFVDFETSLSGEGDNTPAVISFKPGLK